MGMKLNWIPITISLDQDHPLDESSLVTGRAVLLSSNNGRVLIQVYPISAQPNETMYRIQVFDKHSATPTIDMTQRCGSLTGACRVTEELLIPLLGEKLQHLTELFIDLANRLANDVKKEE